MRKTVLFVIALVFALSLCSCGETAADTGKGSSEGGSISTVGGADGPEHTYVSADGQTSSADDDSNPIIPPDTDEETTGTPSTEKPPVQDPPTTDRPTTDRPTTDRPTTDSSAIPESTTKLPESTTKLPEATTKLPEVTTKPPKDTAIELPFIPV